MRGTMTTSMILLKAAKLQDACVYAGMCGAIDGGSGEINTALKIRLEIMYREYSPFSARPFWMGPLNKETKDHRVIALLFAAEVFSDQNKRTD